VVSAPGVLWPTEDEPDPDLLALAAEVRDDDWVRIDTAWERFRRRYGLHLRRDTELGAHRFLVEMFSGARGVGLLRVLAFELLLEDLVTDAFMERLRKVFTKRLQIAVAPAAGELHAFQNGIFLPMPARIAARALFTACDQVCRIDVGGTQRGTGVLVRPRLVATAAHVLWDLVARHADGSPDLRPDGSLRAAEGSLSKLTLTFGDAVDYISDEGDQTERRPGEVARLYPDWLAWGSPPTENERPGAQFNIGDIDGISSDEGPWDLALIRLAVPRLTPRLARLLSEDPPSNAFQIHILHHPHGLNPKGEPLGWSIGTLDRQLGTPPVRCLHDANTLPGSSGAPVFDSGWRIVALHQGGTHKPQSAEADGLAEGSRNRAVPVRHWSEEVDRIERSALDDVPYLTELTNALDLDPTPYPVIGRRETQKWVWDAMRADATAADHVLIIRGEPGTGLRFTKRLVHEMVTPAGDVVMTLDVANALEDSAAEFALRILGTLAAQPSLADVGDPSLNALPRTIRDLVPVLCARLEQLTGDRAAWLVFEGFDAPGLEIPSAVKDLILDLLGGLGEYPSLRLVLAGWPEIPAGYEGSIETLLSPTLEDVVASLIPPGDTRKENLATWAGNFMGIPADEALSGYPEARQIRADLKPLLDYHLRKAGGS
jgi:Trypsin-like peptidase domain